MKVEKNERVFQVFLRNGGVVVSKFEWGVGRVYDSWDLSLTEDTLVDHPKLTLGAAKKLKELFGSDAKIRVKIQDIEVQIES